MRPSPLHHQLLKQASVSCEVIFKGVTPPRPPPPPRLYDRFGNVVLGIPHEAFDGKLAALKDERGVEHDTDLTTEDLKSLVDEYKAGLSTHSTSRV